MRIVELQLKCFRGVKDVKIPLDDLTVLIGENNVGKSSALRGAQLALAKGVSTRRDLAFSEFDFYVDRDHPSAQEAEPISIVLHFAETQAEEWPLAMKRELNEIVQPDLETGLNHVWLEIQGKYEPISESYITDICFLNRDSVPLQTRKNVALLHASLARHVPSFVLNAMRDASLEFGPRGQLWNGFVRGVEIPEEQKHHIEELLRDVNQSVLSGNEKLSSVIEVLKDVAEIVDLDEDDTVQLEAVPSKAFDLTGRINVGLKSSSGVRLPLKSHGEGTQNLSVLLLFKAYVANVLSGVGLLGCEPVLILEEPEAHLHPSAIRRVGKLLAGLRGQRLVSSHSGDLVASVPIKSLRRLYKHDGEIKVGKVELEEFAEDELWSIDQYVRAERGWFLFSKTWVFVEGESDFVLVKRILAQKNYDYDAHGISIIRFSQIPGKGECFIRLAQQLGIEWFLLADGDEAGLNYESKARARLLPHENANDRIYRLERMDVEHEFWEAGYDDFIRSIARPNSLRDAAAQAEGDAQKERDLIIKWTTKYYGKPYLAERIFDEGMRRGASSLPSFLSVVAEKIITMNER